MTIRIFHRLKSLILLLSIFKFSRQFTEETLKFAVAEDAPINTIIGRLDAIDGLTYRLSRGNSKIRFNDETLELSVSSPLDRESEDSIDMLVITSPPSIIHVLIDIQDVNDNAPKFPLDVQKVEIPETAPIGWRVSISGATDPDEGRNGTIGGYGLTETVDTEEKKDRQAPPFSIVQLDGFVYLEVIGRLDRELRDVYSMKLTAKDQGEPELSSSCLLNILILDTNDNPPDFGTRSINIDWNGQPGALFRLNATDADSGDNGRIEYRILGPGNEFFAVSEGNILVTRNTSMNACLPRCELVVEARDSGVPPLTTTLSLVANAAFGNEHEPNINIRFYPADFPFIVVQPEDVNGKTLAILSITDPDGPLGDNATIWIQSGNQDAIFSLISRQSINILTLKNAQNAKKEQYTLEFGANDGQKPMERTATKSLQVFFKQFTQQSFVHVDKEFHVEVEKDTVAGSFVAHVLTNCSDGCSFELMNSDVFKIDPTNGIIVTASELPDDVTSYHLPVKVRLPPPSTMFLETDVFVKIAKETVPKSLIRTTQTTVHLKRAYTFATWQNVTVGTVIGRLPKAQVYSTTDAQSELGVFPDGSIFVGKQVASDFMTLPVILEDRNTTQTSLVSVVVRRSNEHAPSCHVTELHLPENTSPGSIIDRLHASDADSGADGVFSFKLTSSEDDVIHIESSTGIVRSKVSFDAEKEQNYSFTYEVQDYGSPRRSTNCTGILVIDDVNDNVPKFGSKYYSARISGKAGTTVVIVHAEDADVKEENRRIQYRLRNYNTYFHVDKDSGKITTSQILPKMSERLNLTVEAVNVNAKSSDASATSFVLITILNSTELEVKMTSKPIIKIFENDLPGMAVGKIEMTSSDSIIWSTEDPRFLLDSQGNVILKKKTKSAAPFNVTVRGIGSGTQLEQKFELRVKISNSERNDNAQAVEKVLISGDSDNGMILNLTENWKEWRIRRVISETAENENGTNDSFYIKDQAFYSSVNVTEAFVFLESTPKSSGIPHDIKVLHILPMDSDSESAKSSSCPSTVHLITPPATVSIVSNCTNVSLQNPQKPLQIHEGSLLIPSQSELVNHVDLMSKKKTPFMITLIKDSPTEEVKFASNNVLMLLSSVHNIGASFGRVTAESAYRIRYYLVGTTKISIDADTGELFLKERFYRNLNEIQIIAVIPTGIAKARVTIEVIEDRLHLPKSNFVIFAPNSLKSDTPIGKISVGREDVMVDVIDEHFYVRRSEIYAKKFFSPSNSNFYDLEGIVKKGKLSTSINVTIFFGNSGENQSEVRENELMFQVEENSPIGTVVGTVPNSHISKYRLVDQTCGLLIDQDGVIRTTTSFDREKIQLLKTKMIEPSANRIWDLLVFIGDVNDNKPKILNAPGTIELEKDTLKVYKLIWEDSDDVATDVNFSVVDGDPFGHLEVRDSGDIVLKSTPSKSFNATIRLNDNRPPFAVNSHDVTIEFHVSTVTSNIGCKDSEFWISGNVPQKYQSIGKMTASSMTPVTWRILPRSLPRAEFLIDPMTGEILINDGILKNGDVFHLEVQAISFDAESSGFCKARITVADLKSPKPPVFDTKSLEFSISELADRGSPVGRVLLQETAEDVIFRIHNDFNFTISPFDGTIFTNSPFDFEDVKVYRIHVSAEIPGSPASHVDVMIRITDENDEAPRFITGDVVHLKVIEELRTVPYPMIIGSSIAEDLDEGQNGVITYSVVSGNTSLFAVNATTGDILLLAPVDREESNIHELLIEAKDGGIPSLTASSRILIHVEDVNDNAPEFTQHSYFVKIPENHPSGSKVLRVHATDKDKDAELQYSIMDTQEMVPFRIDVATGWITVAGRVDREEKERYEMMVVVKDQEKSARCTVTILIDDINDNAPLIENENVDVFVPDDVAEGDVLYVIDVHDPDKKDHLRYFLNGTDADLFAVSDHGEIFARQKGLPTKSFFTVEVTVVDNVEHATSSQFTFYLHPSKDFPVWKEKMETTSVREHENQELAVFKAKGQGVRYSIVSRCKEHLSIESIIGILSTKNSLDREEFSECPVFVVATSFLDNKPLSAITKILIKVVDINDNNPQFDQQLYHFNVTENSGATIIGRIAARDADSGDHSRIYYEIVGGDRNHEFVISENGEIETVRDLDRETEAEYHLVIEAIDDGKPRKRGNATVIVKVLDEDDNAPRFSRIFHVEIPEDLAVGAFVIQLSASDADETSNHRFALEGDSIPFRVEEDTGKVFVNDTLDFETKSSYRIKVRLTDGVWLIETSLFVTLKDVNDNVPRFEQDEYFLISQENTTTLGKVLATDADSGDNGKIRFSVTSPFFRIDPDTGVITRLRSLQNALTSLEVTASDHGVPRLQRSVTVYVAEKALFKEKLEEKLRGTAKKGDIIGVNIEQDSKVFPRGIATVTSSGDLVLNVLESVSKKKFWIINDKKFVEYSVVEDLESEKPEKNLTISIEALSSGVSVHKLMIPGCSRFLLPTPEKKKEFNLRSDGTLTINAFNLNTTSSLEVQCNDGIWPAKSQIFHVIVTLLSTSESLPTSKVPSNHQKTHQHRLPSALQFNLSPDTPPGTVLWRNEESVPISMEPSSTFSLRNGDLILKSKLDSEKSMVDVFGEEHRRTSITVIPADDSPVCPIFAQQFLFLENSGNRSEVHNFEWKLGEEKMCQINIQPSERTNLFHINGSRLISLSPLLSGTYQLTLISLSTADNSSRSTCHVTITVPSHLTSSSQSQVPSVIFFRENSTTSPHNPLLRLPSAYGLADDSTFSVTDSGNLWSRSSLKSGSRSVIRIPVIDKRLKKKEVIRVLLDNVILQDSEDFVPKILNFHVIRNEKTILNLDVNPNPSHSDFKCKPKTGENFELTENCHVIMPGSIGNFSTTVTSFNATWNVNVINELPSAEDSKLQRSSVELEFFGKKSAISRLIEDLRKTYDDMKIHCLAISELSEDLKYRSIFAMVDRNNVVVEASEVQRTLTSFLEKHRPNYIDFLTFGKDHCAGVTCTQPNVTCHTAIKESSRRLVSRSDSVAFDLPMSKLVGRCVCVEGMDCGKHFTRLQKTQKAEVVLFDSPQNHENCDDMDCDGECVMEDRQPVCRCRDGKTAFESLYNCERASEAFSTSSESFLDLKLKNSTVVKCDDGCKGVQQIEVDFRTTQLNSELVHVDFGNQKAGIQIVSGTITFSLSDDFTRLIQTTIERQVSDGRWHRMLFQMAENGKKILIQVDGRGKEVKSRVSLPMMLTAHNIRLLLSPDLCFRRLLAQNQFVHPVLSSNKLFDVSTPSTSISSSCQFDPQLPASTGFFSSFSDTTTVVLLSVFAIISVIAVAVCLMAIRRRWNQKKSEGKTERSGWQKATEIDAFAVRPRRGHVNRSMVKSPDDDTYDVTSVYGTQMKTTSTDDISHVYTTSASRRYQPPVSYRRDGHINMAYL